MRRLRLHTSIFWLRPRTFASAGNHPIRCTLSIDGAVHGTIHDTDATNNGAIVFPDDWDFEFDAEARPIVSGRPKPLEVEYQIHHNAPRNHARIARFRRTIPWPYQAENFFDNTRKVQTYYSLDDIQPPEVTGMEGFDGLYACREVTGGALATTLSGGTQRIRIEVHDVIPTPTGRAAPQRPLPPEPTSRSFEQAYTAAELAAPGAMNLVENPAVIPILPAGTAANADNAARFRVTYYSPAALGLLETNDPDLVWRIQPMDGNARFFGPPQGRRVSIHGTTAGEIGLEIRFRGNVVAFYRALVAPLVFIPCRCTILHGRTDTAAQRAARPTTARIETHLLTANRFLWQLGIQLRLQDAGQPIGFHQASIPDAAFVETATAGIWTAEVPANRTANVDSESTTSQLLNGHAWVPNFVYIRSFNAGILGLSTATGARASTWVTDSGTPSASWIPPCGVRPDRDSRTNRLRLFVSPSHGHPNFYPMLLSDAHTSDFEFAGTIAHEFGHSLNLDHRIENPDHVPEWGDRLNHPPSTNLMHWNNPTTLAQDLDIIQAKAVRGGPLIQHYTP